MKDKKLRKIIKKLTNGKQGSFNDKSMSWVSVENSDYVLEFQFNYKGTKLISVALFAKDVSFEYMITSIGIKR